MEIIKTTKLTKFYGKARGILAAVSLLRKILLKSVALESGNGCGETR